MPHSHFIRKQIEENFIQCMDSLKRGTKVILCCRVSTWQQGHRKHLQAQERYLRKVCKQYGLVVVAVFYWIGPGLDPAWLSPAVQEAAAKEAVLLAESTSRFIRAADYHSVHNPTAQPKSADFAELKRSTGAIRLYTAIPPDASLKEERASQTTRGEQRRRGPQTKKSPGYKKRRRLRLLPQVLLLHKQKRSLREIAKATGLPWSTVRLWLVSDEEKKTS